jgi:hypothetical protein
VEVNLGKRKPLLDDANSSTALESGVRVPIPAFLIWPISGDPRMIKRRKEVNFILQSYIGLIKFLNHYFGIQIFISLQSIYNLCLF